MAFQHANESPECQNCSNECMPLLPKLHDGAGHVRRVCQAVVGKALLCIPGVVAGFPWEVLKQGNILFNDLRFQKYQDACQFTSTIHITHITHINRQLQNLMTLNHVLKNLNSNGYNFNVNTLLFLHIDYYLNL